MHAIRTSLLGLAFLAFASVPSVAEESHKSHDINLGFLGVSTDVDMKELGLPVYPGAHRRVEKDKDDSSSAHVWAGLGWFGFKVVVVELESADAPSKIAAFYRPALAKFGPIVDCAAGAPEAKDTLADCKDNRPKPGDVLLKAGNKRSVHIVAAERQGAGSKIALVFLELRGTDH